MELKFRPLNEDEIECRVGTVKEGKGISLLLYQNARVAMDILDETVGPMNWKREHSRDNANCTISIWDEEKNQWVSKEEVGTEANTEKEKSIASDSFKRSAVSWGIGRQLYSSPFIWIPSDKGGKYDKYSVEKIAYSDDKKYITGISIMNDTKKERVFVWKKQ